MSYLKVSQNGRYSCHAGIEVWYENISASRLGKVKRFEEVLTDYFAYENISNIFVLAVKCLAEKFVLPATKLVYISANILSAPRSVEKFAVHVM